jgi:hypothetical protein
MAEVTVYELAKAVGAPVERLLKQIKDAGLPQKSSADLVTDFDKQALLAFLKSAHEEGPRKITLQRKTKATINPNKRKSVKVEIRRIEPPSETKSEAVPSPKVFVSYSWDSVEHKAWVEKFASMLRSDGVDATLDQWSLHPGDPITHFMEKSIKDADFVLIICTSEYKKKSDSKIGGAGYEDSIISSDMFNKSNHRKYLPIIRSGNYKEIMPNSLHSKLFIDFSNESNFSNVYRDLLLTLFGQRPKEPPLGKVPDFINS